MCAGDVVVLCTVVLSCHCFSALSQCLGVLLLFYCITVALCVSTNCWLPCFCVLCLLLLLIVSLLVSFISLLGRKLLVLNLCFSDILNLSERETKALNKCAEMLIFCM